VLLNYLHRRGVPVSRPVLRRDGAYIERVETPEGPRDVMLFTGAPGIKRVRMTAQQSALFGRAAALLHEQTDRQRRVYARYEINLPHLSNEPLAALRPFCKHRPQDFAYIERVGAACTDALANLPRGTPAYGLCHGDLHAGNARFGALRHIWLLGLQADMTKIWGSLWLDDGYIDRAVRFLKRWAREYKLSV
jgi:Ser/Thr protein kinase RdoA (MazF antagonist)